MLARYPSRPSRAANDRAPAAGDGGGRPRRVGERDEVDLALVVVERDQPVAEHQRGVGQRGAVGELAPVFGLELVAEVAGEAAGEVERQLGRVGVQALELELAAVEDVS